MTCPMRTYLGPYAFGGLEPDEEAKLGRHLDECPQCRATLREIAWIPSWLHKIPAEEIEVVIAEDEAVAAASAQRGPNKWLSLAAVAAAVVAIAFGITTAVTRDTRPLIAASRIESVDQRTHVAAALTMTPQGDRTALHLNLTGVAPGEHCSLIARTKDGRADAAARWTATYRGMADIPATTSVPADKLSGFDVVTADGRVLVRLDVPAHR